jgi:hypothetical protein
VRLGNQYTRVDRLAQRSIGGGSNERVVDVYLLASFTIADHDACVVLGYQTQHSSLRSYTS